MRRSRMIDRATHRVLFLTLCLLWPALVGCSSSAPQPNSIAAASYPQQARVAPPQPAPAAVPAAMQNAVAPSTPVAGTTLAGLSPPRSESSPTPRPTPTVAPAQATLSAAAGQATSLAPSVSANGATAKPAAAAPPDDFDAAASAYPSVALFDLFRQNSASQARAANPPLLSDSVTPQPASGQPAAAPPAAQPAAATSAAVAPATSSSDDNFDAAASAYPSVPLFGHSQ